MGNFEANFADRLVSNFREIRSIRNNDANVNVQDVNIKVMSLNNCFIDIHKIYIKKSKLGKD